MDSEMVKKLGTSLIVPSVQELAKQPITKVPGRYLRPNQDPAIVSNTTSIPQVPIIDLNKLMSEDSTELEKLNQACKEWGFFQGSKPWRYTGREANMQREDIKMLIAKWWDIYNDESLDFKNDVRFAAEEETLSRSSSMASIPEAKSSFIPAPSAA